MGSDLARITYDPTRQYRSVVAQQGRVTLEADVNEASRIAAEALRRETIDLVGPAATPDGGYAVGLDANGNIVVGAGTLYLGGWRLRLPMPVKLSAQPDWLDMPAFQVSSNVSLIALLLTEQSVCAVEDTALREVALGGPDTAARSRLMQHFLRLPAGGEDCATAAQTVASQLQQEGITIDPKTDQLHSSARLQVGFTPPTTPPDPCEPAAQGGYLGADNQMVRVTVTAFDAVKRAGTLAWGWNNASFLYRATVASPQTLSLSPQPLDAEHAPQQGQAIEILQTQADLGDGDLIASISGSIVVLTQAYDPDTNLLTLPSGFTLPDTKNPLFVRLWQGLVPFTPGTPVALDSVSGLTVDITMTALPTIAARPFWHFAVRPNTPVIVYPRRYLEAPQPPDGPRQWLCDLAVISGTGKDFSLLGNCLGGFPGGRDCCAIVMGPADVAAKGGLQPALDALAAIGLPATLSLRAGTYTLAAPLSLTAKHASLTLEGCGDGVTLQADPKALAGFNQGMLVLQQASGFTLRRVTLNLPAAPSPFTGEPIVLMAGLFATDSPDLTVDACHFVFAPSPKAAATGAAIFAGGDCTGSAVRHSSFACTTLSGTQARSLFGVYFYAAAAGAALDDIEVSGNLFTQLGFGISVNATSGTGIGLLRFNDNRMRQCDLGIFISSAGGEAAPAPPIAAGALAQLQPDRLMALSTKLHASIAAAGAKPTALPAAAVPSLTPALHIRDNDITLAAPSTYCGLSVALTGNTPAQALIGGNRIATATTGVPAALVTLYPAQAVITGNLFTQGIGQAGSTVPCATLQVYGGGFEVMANVIHPTASILPARPTPLPATSAWEFLNSVG